MVRIKDLPDNQCSIFLENRHPERSSSRILRATQPKDPEILYIADTLHTFSTSNSCATASSVGKVLRGEVRQIHRGPSTARLAKNARRSAQDDDFGEEIKRGNHSRSSLATLQNRSLLEPLWRLAAGDVAHNVGSQEVQIEVVP